MERAASGDDPTIEAVQAAFRASYADVQYAYVQFLTEHLADCARAFGGDLSQVLVLGVLGQRRIEAVRAEGPAATSDPSRTAMSALRLADVSGLPRETVRRKLIALQARGFVDQDKRRGWYLVAGGDGSTSEARLALRDLDERSHQRLSRLYLRLREAAERSEETPGR